MKRGELSVPIWSKRTMWKFICFHQYKVSEIQCHSFTTTHGENNFLFVYCSLLSLLYLKGWNQRIWRISSLAWNMNKNQSLIKLLLQLSSNEVISPSCWISIADEKLNCWSVTVALPEWMYVWTLPVVREGACPLRAAVSCSAATRLQLLTHYSLFTGLLIEYKEWGSLLSLCLCLLRITISPTQTKGDNSET